MSCEFEPMICSKLIIKGNTEKTYIAFTYDAGLDDFDTTKILAVLAKHNVKCTFFLTGIWAEKFPALSMQIVREGHEIGNHSYDHSDMATISYSEMLKTIFMGEKAIESITSINPNPLFRMPFGSFNDEVLNAVGEAGYPYSIYWDIDPKDWEQPSVQAIVNRILYKVKNGSIVLLHLNGINTARATEIAIENLKARGFIFLKISELIKHL